MFKRLKSIEDNLVEADDNDNKVSIFRIIKDIKDRGIKIDNDDETIREIRDRIKELIDDGVKVNNFDEMKKEIIDHVKKLKEQGANVKADKGQIDDLINKIFDKKYEKYTRKTYIESEIDKILKDYGDKNIYINYGDKGNKNKFDTENITRSLEKLRNKFINFNEFKEEYNKFINNVEELKNYKSKNNASFSKNQLKMKRYARDLKDIVDPYILKSDIDTSEKDSGTSEKDSDTSEKDTSEKGIDTSNKGEGLKILSNK